MRLKTLAAGMTLAFVGLAGSAAHADSASLGVQANSSTDTALGGQAGNDTLGIGSSTEAGVDVSTRTEGASPRQGERHTETRAGHRTDTAIDAEHRGEAGVEATRESATEAGANTTAGASDRSQSVLEGASDTLETGRKTGEQWRDEATQASGNLTDNLGIAGEAQGSADASGELR